MTTIYFPIITFTLVFLTGLTIGIYISSLFNKRKQTNYDDFSPPADHDEDPSIVTKEDGLDVTYIDHNGNKVKVPVQNITGDPSFLRDDINHKKTKS